MTNAHIYAPSDYVGAIMELCQDRRGVFRDMTYLAADRVDIHYELPLNEIIYDFFDALKSRTRGYASFDYEISEYQRSDLVKLDVLLNGDAVDALSFIIHTEKAYARARKIAEKLKENIPRQMFEIPIQIGIGGKSLRAKPSRRCARMCWPSATGAISPAKRSCWKSRRKARNVCVISAQSKCRRRRLWPCSSLMRTDFRSGKAVL